MDHVKHLKKKVWRGKVSVFKGAPQAKEFLTADPGKQWESISFGHLLNKHRLATLLGTVGGS